MGTVRLMSRVSRGAAPVAGPTLDVTREQIIAFRRRTGALDERLPPGPASLGRAAWVGLQDSVPRSALHSLHARVGATAPDAWEDPSLVQVWGLRYTAYVVPAGDHAPFTLGRLPDDGRTRRVAEDLAARLHAYLKGRRLDANEAGRGLGIHPNALRYAAMTGTVLIRWTVHAGRRSGQCRVPSSSSWPPASSSRAATFAPSALPPPGALPPGPASSRARRSSPSMRSARPWSRCARRSEKRSSSPPTSRCSVRRLALPPRPGSFRAATRSTCSRVWIESSSSRIRGSAPPSGRPVSGRAPSWSAATSPARGVGPGPSSRSSRGAGSPGRNATPSRWRPRPCRSQRSTARSRSAGRSTDRPDGSEAQGRYPLKSTDRPNSPEAQGRYSLISNRLLSGSREKARFPFRVRTRYPIPAASSYAAWQSATRLG